MTAPANMTAAELRLIPVDDIEAHVPGWPLRPWSTRALIRKGLLGHVRVGRRVFLTRELIDEYLALNTSHATPVATGGGSR